MESPPYEECPVVFHFDLILACHVFILKCYEYCIFLISAKAFMSF